jgi:3-hydroxymyristoyl/3-hydroxydecanoyl-(acyl carrier protein) dehydratase
MAVSAPPDVAVRYYLVDRISEWEADKRIRGVKNVAMTEDFLQYHFPRRPTMPGVLLLEAMTQLAGWLEAVSSDFSRWFLLEHVTSCKFYDLTGPGDQVEITLEVVPAAEPLRRRYRGAGSVGGKRRIVAEFDGQVIPLADIEAPSSQRQLFEVLTNTATFSLAPTPDPADR